MNSDNVRIQWHAGKCLTTGSWGEKEAWFTAFAHFCDVNTPTMVCFKLQHEVICLAKFLKLTVSTQALLSWSKPVVAHQRVMIYSLFCSDQSAWRSVGLWSLSIFQYRCCSITKSCLTLWLRGLQHVKLPCPLAFPEFAQTHVHWISDAIQPSHPLSPPSPVLNLS